MSTSCIQLPPHITLSEIFKTFGLGPARSQASLLPVLKLQSLGAGIPVISCFYLTSFKSYPICCSVWPWVTPLTNINQPTSWWQPGARRFLRFLRFLVFCRPTWVPPITMTATDFTFWSFWLRAALQSRDLLRLDSSTPQEIQDALTCCFSGFTIFLISLQKLVFGARRKKEKTWKNNTSQMIPPMIPYVNQQCWVIAWLLSKLSEGFMEWDKYDKGPIHHDPFDTITTAWAMIVPTSTMGQSSSLLLSESCRQNMAGHEAGDYSGTWAWFDYKNPEMEDPPLNHQMLACSIHWNPLTPIVARFWGSHCATMRWISLQLWYLCATFSSW